MSGTLLIRADASVAMGTGHVMRCLALAQAWQDVGGTVVFALAQSTPAIDTRLRREGVEIATVSAVSLREDAACLVELAQRRDAKWVVVDGYHFDDSYQGPLRDVGIKLLLIDDGGGASRYCADLVLNQNAYASEGLYALREPYTRLLLGTRYALLRREFRSPGKAQTRAVSTGSKVLVVMGGSDPDNVTLEVIRALQVSRSAAEAIVVVGGSNPHFDILQQESRQSAGIRLVREPENLPELIAESDIAVSAAGSTCWELCRMGIPFIAVDLAPNQTPVAEALHRFGAALHLGSRRNVGVQEFADGIDRLLGSTELRAALAARGPELVDGRGASRVVVALCRSSIALRRAQENDARAFWEWVNDPLVRAASFSPDPIGWDDHVVWFLGKLRDPRCRLYIGSVDGQPIGQVRLDYFTDHEAELDISVAPRMRGFGYGHCLLDLVCESEFIRSKGTVLHAFIKPENRASIATFETVGFCTVGGVLKAGHQALHYILCHDEHTSNGSGVPGRRMQALEPARF